MRATIGSIALAAIVQACTTAKGGPCFIDIYPVGDEMPDLDMLVGDTVETPLEDHFSNADSGCIRSHAYQLFEASSSDPSAVAVSILDFPVLRTVALAEADSVRVVVVYAEDVDTGIDHEFLVRVRPR